MILTRMGVVAASKASGSIPPGPFTDGTYYYVVQNRVSVHSKRVQQNPRAFADNLSYNLYEKPDGTNQSSNPFRNGPYNFLTSSVNPDGNYTNCQACPPNTLYLDSSTRWATTINVTVTNGYPSYSFPDGGTGSRGGQFYIDAVLPFIP